MLPGRATRKSEGKPLRWRDILTIGLGELGLNPSELYEYTLEEFLLKMEGFRGHIWNIQKEQWEMVRALAFENAVMSGKTLTSKSLTPERFWPFSWDEKKGLAGLTDKEQIKATALELRRRILDAAKRSMN